MEAIKNLKIFRESIDKNDFEPKTETIDKLGNELVEAACTSEGYAELVWQAGEDLLVVSELVGEGVDIFYERFGYTAVANALRASIEDGNFPLSLGFISHNFLPSGGLDTLAHNPHIQQTLTILQNAKVTLSPQSFRDTPNAIEISSQFLDYAQALNVPIRIRLQIAAILLLVATSEKDRELATRILLNQLASNEKTISLFYCWRAACEHYPALWDESTYKDSLLTFIKACRTLQDQGAAILSQIHTDRELLDVVTFHPRLLYVMGLSGWWLYVRYNHTEGKDTAFNLLWSIMSIYPKLCKALKSYLESESLPEQSPEEIEQLQKDFQKEMRILQEELRLRIYRGLPLTLEIGSYNRINILEPLYEALEGSSALPASIHTTIHALNATALLDDNPKQKAALKSFQITGNVRSDMINDYETTIASLRRALELREKLSAASTEAATTLPLGTPEIKQEVAAIIEDDPELHCIFEWFLPETLQAISSAQFAESL